MKQKNTAIGKAFLCGSAAMLLLAGCVKESAINEKYRPAGTPITFSAATGYENGTGTRTEYSGQLYGNTPKYERIDWLSGDPVTIVYAQGTGTPTTSQYIVTEVSGDTDRNSYASVEVAEGQTKLTWGDGEGVHKFYAMYPSKGFKGNDDADLTNNGTHVKGVIPHIQTVHLSADGTKYLPAMEYGYMVAYKEIAANSTESRVTLPFTPAVTAFEFKLQRAADEEDLKVTAINLSSVADSESDQTPLHGDFEFDITGGNENGATWGTVTTSRVEYSLDIRINGEGGIGPLSIPAHDSGTYLDFTFFALPVEQTNLQLRLNFENGTSKTLKLNNQDDTPHVFAAAKKHIITNTNVPGGGGFQYVLQLTGTTITLDDGTVASVLSRDSFTAGESSTAPFESYYTADGGVTKTPVDVEVFEYGVENADGSISWSSSLPDGLVSTTITGAEVDKTIKAELTVNRDVDHFDTPFIERSRALKQRSPASDLDLSLYEAGKLVTPRTGNKRITANTYIIDRPGTFKFPLVYGNAVDWTRTKVVNGVDPQTTGCNVYAYSDGTGRPIQSGYWPDFYRFDGKIIQSPYILSDLGVSSADVEAVVVWEDVESAEYSMITLQSTISDENVNGFCNLDGSALGTVPYIKFTIPQGNIIEDEKMYPFHRVTGIREGNIVIALRTNKALTIAGEEFPAHTLLWDWHIWISNEDMTPINLHTRPPYNTVTDSNDILPVENGFTRSDAFVYYAERVLYVKLKQSSESSVAPIVFKIVQAEKPFSYRGVSATGNQWGRHTPTLPTMLYYNAEFSNTYKALYLFKDAYSPSGYSLSDPNNPEQSESWFGLRNIARLPYDNQITSSRTTFQNPTGVYLSSTNTCYPIDATHQGPFWNLWNMEQTDGSHVDIKVFKTVYDPCPPGYCIPHAGAFSNLVKSGGLYGTITDPSQFNVKDRNGDGAISVAGDYNDDYMNGWDFFTGNGDETFRIAGEVRPSSHGRSYGFNGASQTIETSGFNSWLQMHWTAGCFTDGSRGQYVYFAPNNQKIIMGKRTPSRLSGSIFSVKELD